MIFIMSEKTFKKNVEKIATKTEYFGLDCANYGVVKKEGNTAAISSRYQKMSTCGNLCPELRLYRMLRKLKDGEPVRADDYEKEVQKFLESDDFSAGAVAVFRALVAANDASENVILLLILPNVVYKYLSAKISSRLNELAGFDLGFVTKEEFKQSPNRIQNAKMNEEVIRKLKKRAKKIYNRLTDGDDDY